MIIIVSLFLFVISFTIPYIGISVNKINSKWQVSKVDNLGWGKYLGITTGDIIEKINEEDPNSNVTIKKYGFVENINSLEINRAGEIQTFTIPKEIIQDILIYHIIIPFFIFSILLFLSIFLYVKNGKNQVIILLIYFFLAIGFSYISAGASARLNTLGLFINRLSLLFIPVLFLHFLFEYFRQYNIIWFNRKILKYYDLIVGITIAIHTFFMMVYLGDFYLHIKSLVLIVFSLGFLFDLVVLIYGYLKNRHSIYKSIFKIMIIGIAVAFFPFVFLVVIPEIAFGFDLIPVTVAASFLIFIPIVFMYLVSAKQLFDIDFALGRLRYYSILSLFMSAFLLFLIYLMQVVDFTLSQWGKMSIVLFFGFILFSILKEELDYRIRSRLNSDKYNLQASLEHFSQNISRVTKINELEDFFIKEIKETLSIQKISLFELNKDTYSLKVRRGTFTLSGRDVDFLNKNRFPNLSIGELVQLHHGVCVVIREKAESYYLLWLDNKKNKIKLNRDEGTWVKTIARYISIMYENLTLVEEFMKELEKTISHNTVSPLVLRLLFNIQEKERRRLSADLHDTVLQDQINLYRKLDLIIRDQDLPVKYQKQLYQLSQEILDINYEIRETCNELRPPLLNEKGIVESLTNLFFNAQLRYNFKIRFDAAGFHQNLDDEYTLTIYRIVQELITNAAKHSKATEVVITLDCLDNDLYLYYKDNGVGMDLNEIQPSFAHMGLSGIRERVISLNGEIKLHSSLGNGFEVMILIPLTLDTK